MSNPSEEEVYVQAKHVHCVTCDSLMSTGGLTFHDEDDLDEQAYDVLMCCGDPFYEAVIVSKEPLFPPDNKEVETNSDYWNPGTEQYEYNVPSLLDLLAVDAEVQQGRKKK